MNKPERLPGYFDWHKCTEYAISQGFDRKLVEEIWNRLCRSDPPHNGSVFWLFESEDLSSEANVLINWLVDEFDEQFWTSW